MLELHGFGSDDYLIVRDLQLAADLLKPVHSQTYGRDGYVQFDLPPDTWLDAETAIASAPRIWQRSLIVGLL